MQDEKPTDVTFRIIVEGHGQPIIFIHGWAASQRFWKHQVDYFSQRYQVITYDLRGHGDSDKPKQGYYVEDHVFDLAQIIQGLKLQVPILVGHSLGGLIALQFALDYPEGLKALVVVGTSPNPVPTKRQSLMLTLFSWLIRLSEIFPILMTGLEFEYIFFSPLSYMKLRIKTTNQ